MAHAKERDERRRYVASRSANDPKPPAEPARVWLVEDDDPAPSDSTVDRLVRRARHELVKEGRRAAKSERGNLVLGKLAARIDHLWARALAANRLHVAVRVVELDMRLHGLEGAITLKLGGIPAAEGGAPIRHVDETPRTRETDATELAALVLVARQRMQARTLGARGMQDALAPGGVKQRRAVDELDAVERDLAAGGSHADDN
jgi:hypothetical protein